MQYITMYPNENKDIKLFQTQEQLDKLVTSGEKQFVQKNSCRFSNVTPTNTDKGIFNFNVFYLILDHRLVFEDVSLH